MESHDDDQLDYVKVGGVFCNEESDGSIIPYEIVCLLPNKQCKCRNLVIMNEDVYFDCRYVAKKIIEGRK
jgi:hypothetical protein